MENKILNIIDTFWVKLTVYFELLKTKALILFEMLRPYIQPYEKELIWIVPPVVLLLLILRIYFKIRSRKKEKPADVIKEEPEYLEETIPEEIETTKQEDVATDKEIDDQPEKQEIPEKKETIEKPVGILKNLRTGLSKTRKAFSSSVDRIFSGGSLNDDMLEELEELLITSDVGVKTAMEIIETLMEKKSEITGPDDLKRLLKEEILNYIDLEEKVDNSTNSKPHVMMVVGVNGVGKTTTIGKLASKYVNEGKKVLIVAADTFRAAASDQLKIWADRSGADIVRHKDNSDPSAVAFDGMEAAVARNVDIVIIDTAGRLHTKKNLMEELKKIERTISKKIPEAPHETLMVVDATTGQNALQQAILFNEAIGINSIALTKLDGTAKGGIVIGITNTLNIPLKYVGVGEQVGDLQDFDAKEFADALI